MKLSLRSASMFALSFMALGSTTASCARTEGDAFVPQPDDTGDAALPNGEADAATPDAPTEVTTKLCSDHGFCRTDLPPDQTLRAVWGDGTGVAWAVTAEGNVLRWDGKAWTVHASNLGPLVGIWGSSPTDIWLGGDKGVLHGTGATSESLSFAEQTLPGEPVRIASVWGFGEGDVWAAGVSDDRDTGMGVGRVLRLMAAEAGSKWEDVAVPGDLLSCSGVWGSPKVGVWIGCSRPLPADPVLNELVILRKHGVDDFVEVPMPVDPDDDPVLFGPETFSGAVAISDSSIWIFGVTRAQWPGMWHGTSADSGETFTFLPIREATPQALKTNAVFGAAPNDIWAVGEYGRTRHWDGSTWSTVAITNTQLPIIDPLYGVWSGGPSEVWLVGKQIALRFDPAHEKDGGVP